MENNKDDIDELALYLIDNDDALYEWASGATEIILQAAIEELDITDEEKKKELTELLGDGWDIFNKNKYGRLTVIYDPKPAIRTYLIRNLYSLENIKKVEMLTTSFVRRLLAASFKQAEHFLENVYGIAEDTQQILWAKSIKDLDKNNKITKQDKNDPMLKRDFPTSLLKQRISKINNQLTDAYSIKKGGSESKGIVSDEKKQLLAKEYPAILSHWKDIHTLSRNGSDWRDKAKTNKFPDTPDDLLNKLESTDKENISCLAIEHAGRRVGIMKTDGLNQTTTTLRELGIMATGYSRSQLMRFKEEGDTLLISLKNDE